MLRPTIALLLAGIVGVGLAPAAVAATKPAAPDPLTMTANFPDGSTQSTTLGLKTLPFVADAVRIVDRPTPSSIVFDTYAKEKTSKDKRVGARAAAAAKLVRCERVTLAGALVPAAPTDEPLSVVRTLMPDAILEEYESQAGKAAGKLVGTGKDIRVAIRVSGDLDTKVLTGSVAVTDWAKGTARGWKEVAVKTKSLSTEKVCAESLVTVLPVVLLAPSLQD
jgi:hypothetical protein